MAYLSAARRRNLVVLATLVVAGGGLVVYWWVTHPRSPEEAIRRVLNAMETAAEQGRTGAFMRHISDRYLDEAGYTKRTLGQLALQALRGTHSFEVVVNNPQIRVEDETAEVEARVLIITETEGQLSYDITARFEKETVGGWLVVWSSGWQGSEYRGTE